MASMDNIERAPETRQPPQSTASNGASNAAMMATVVAPPAIRRHEGRRLLLATVAAWLMICVPANMVALYLKWRLEQPKEDQTDQRQLNDSSQTTENGQGQAETEQEQNKFDDVDDICYEDVQEYAAFLAATSFWLQGVAMTVIGSAGLMGNILSVAVLLSKNNPAAPRGLRRIGGGGNVPHIPVSSSARSFSRVLAILAVVDSVVILFFVLDISFCGQFLPEEPFIYRWLYPMVIHPLRNMSLTASIFMVVAISAERYKAICHPFGYRPKPHTYAIVVAIFTLGLEIPRFLEFESIDRNGRVDYFPTPLNMNPDFIHFSAYWDDILVTGLLPFAALIFFNGRIYARIRQSSHEYRFVGRRQSLSPPPRSDAACVGQRGQRTRPLRHDLRTEATSNTGSHGRSGAIASVRSHRGRERDDADNVGTDESPTEMRHLRVERPTKDNEASESSSGGGSRRSAGAKKGRGSRSGASSQRSPCSRSPASATARSRRSPDNGSAAGYFRRRRDKTTAVCISIVLAFAACHIYRFAVQIMEIWVTGDVSVSPERMMACHLQKRHSVPVNLQIIMMVNHVFIVVNSSINFLLYCLSAHDFRRRCWSMLRSLCWRTGVARLTSPGLSQARDTLITV